MVDGNVLVQEFNIGDLSPEQQTALIEQYTFELGEAISEGVPQERLDEFTEIINGNDDVIDAWLTDHAPGYREDPAFAELRAGYDDDPERVPAEKVYASIGWVRVNRPDFDAVNTRTKQAFRERIAAARAPQ